MDEIVIGSFVILHFRHCLPRLTNVNDIIKVFGSEYVPNLSLIKVPSSNHNSYCRRRKKCDIFLNMKVSKCLLVQMYEDSLNEALPGADPGLLERGLFIYIKVWGSLC